MKTLLFAKPCFRTVDVSSGREAADLESDNTVVYVAEEGKLIGAVALQDMSTEAGAASC